MTASIEGIVHGNSLEIMPQLPNGSVDLVVADPPYNLGKDFGKGNDEFEFERFLSFTENWTRECQRVLKPAGSIYIFMGVQFISHLFHILRKQGFIFNSWVVWHYTQGIGKTRGFSPRHDDILFFTKSKEFTFNLDAVRVPQKYYRSVNNMKGANPGDVWAFSHLHYCAEERLPHPTQKPEILIERMILASSNVGDFILDPFVGSGTTAAVAKRLHRRFLGIEVDDGFWAMAHARTERIEPIQLEMISTHTGPDHRNEGTKRLAKAALDEFKAKVGSTTPLPFD